MAAGYALQEISTTQDELWVLVSQAQAQSAHAAVSESTWVGTHATGSVRPRYIIILAYGPSFSSSHGGHGCLAALSRPRAGGVASPRRPPAAFASASRVGRRRGPRPAAAAARRPACLQLHALTNAPPLAHSGTHNDYPALTAMARRHQRRRRASAGSRRTRPGPGYSHSSAPRARSIEGDARASQERSGCSSS